MNNFANEADRKVYRDSVCLVVTEIVKVMIAKEDSNKDLVTAAMKALYALYHFDILVDLEGQSDKLKEMIGQRKLKERLQ